MRVTNSARLTLAFLAGCFTVFVVLDEGPPPDAHGIPDMKVRTCDNCLPVPEPGCSFYLSNVLPGHRHGVVTDPQQMLSTNYTPKVVQLTLIKDEDTMYYEATIPFDMFHVSIFAKPDICNKNFALRLHDKNSGAREMPFVWSFPAATHNLWLLWSSSPATDVDGRQVGSNAFDQDISFTLTRENLPKLPSSSSKDDLPACYFEQECGLLLAPDKPCGVQPLPNYPTWQPWLSRQDQLPYCEHGDAAGRWVLPCSSCQQDSMCMWDEAKWQPYNCRYRKFTTEELQSCMVGVKMLYVGDSTMRGLYFRLLERVNGTLIGWSKTRSVRTDLGVNGGRTDFTFNYYYRVGGGANQKLKISDHFINQFERMSDLKNDSSTVLIMGGQTWLNEQDMPMMRDRLLPKFGLQGARIIAKTLNTGMPYDPNGNVCRLLEKNMALTRVAKEHNVLLVDTFNITVSRYMEFYGGGCVCHFQFARNMGVYQDGGVVYKMEGPVNNVHEEILEHVLCHKP